jgi:general stress protein 26
MDNTSDPQEIRKKFWKALDDSPFLMLALEQYAAEAVPMTAHLDPDANSSIWFFTSRRNHLAELGPAIANFASKDHAIFASFDGELVEETSQERLDRHWSNMIEAWFPDGKDSPDLVMLRMDLGNASIWDSQNMGIIGIAKMFLGMDVRDNARGGHIETIL